ncbi:DUF4157 domain-containing protein [Roseateles sp. So40a]|uniref:eCIS core domain-containing protein n=1 Tax=Roseateles sp. So40a TaxID=3400226 RepID=UPI003A83E78E
MKRHDTKEAAGDRQPAAASAVSSAAMPETATAPPDSARMVRQAAQLKRLRGGEPASEASHAATSAEAAPERGGLPAQLRAGLEAMSGQDLGDVRVHYGSSKPAQLEAHAYAQGRDIHLAPGQEQHLPHEAWHVVQQAQGRVKPTTTMGGGVPVNDHVSLEREADVMGTRAMSAAPVQRKSRIDLDHDKTKGKKDEIAKKIEDLKAAKREAKRVKTANWVKDDGSGQPNTYPTSRDTTFNTDIAGIRQKYELAIKALAESYGASDALKSGSAYYGTELAETPGVFKRPDNNKEYVQDRRGTFVSRYVRRELNRRDDINKPGGLTPTGYGTYGDLVNHKDALLPGGTTATDALSWNHREYLQQSMGGGGNQFAFSHTSTKRPILSNDHETFGEHNGAVLVDLAQLPKDSFGAQWQINPTDGHKEPLAPGKLPPVTRWDSTKTDKQAEKVAMSGYRNMEIVAHNVSKASMVHHWAGPEGKKSVYDDGRSARGQLMVDKRRELETPKPVVVEPKKGDGADNTD